MAQVTIKTGTSDVTSRIFGSFDVNIRALEDRFGVRIMNRSGSDGDAVIVSGENEDGVRLAVSRLNAEPTTAAMAANATSKHVKLFDGVSGDAKYTVYARKKDGKILLLSVGQKGEERARAVGVAMEKDGKYLIEHWEH